MSVRMGKKFMEMSAQMIGAPLLLQMARLHRIVRHSWMLSGGAGGEFRGDKVCPALGAFVVHQYGVAATILGAGLRLMRISHVDTQKILYELNGRTASAYEDAAAARLSDMSGYAPLTDILAAVHTKSHVRLFMN